jgi:type IV pilus assembly protein PilC
MFFIYKGYASDGSEKNGEIVAIGLDEAVKTLQGDGILISSIEERVLTKSSFKLPSTSLFDQKITQKDIVIFSRQISTLFEAGVSALKAFLLLSAENPNKTLVKRLMLVADDIETGLSLSDSMAKHPDLFSTFYISMVKAGEESGKLNESFLYLADSLDRDYELREKTKKALMYPIFVISVFIVILLGMFSFVIPKMAALFEDKSKLPMITKVMLNISDFVTSNIIGIGVVAVGGFFSIRWYLKTSSGRYLIDRTATRMPGIKDLVQKIFLARLSDNMNTMLTSGVPIVRSIEITADVVENIIYHDLLFRVSDKVQNGLTFSQALSEESDVPRILTQMSAIGEETGQLGYILKSLASFYKREVDSSIDSTIGLIEPIMIVTMGLMVSVLVMAIMLPVFSLAENF